MSLRQVSQQVGGAHVAVFKKIASEAPTDWQRCLRAVQGCTVAGVVGFHQLPLDPILSVLRTAPSSTWHLSMHLLSLVQSATTPSTGSSREYGSLQHAALVQMAAACLHDRTQAILGEQDGVVAAPHAPTSMASLWQAALAVQGAARTAHVQLSASHLQSTIVPILEAEHRNLDISRLGGQFEPNDPLVLKRNAIETALQLERVELVYRSLRMRLNTTEEALVGSSSSLPSVKADSGRSNTIQHLAEAAVECIDVPEQHRTACDALCTAIEQSDDIEAVLRILQAVAPDLLVCRVQVVAAVSTALQRRLCTGTSDVYPSTVHTAATAPSSWGMALWLLRRPLSDASATARTTSTCGHGSVKAHAIHRVLSAGYIVAYVFAANVRSECGSVVLQRLLDEIRRSLADLYLLHHCLVLQHAERSVVGASEMLGDACAGDARMEEDALRHMEVVASPFCSQWLTSADNAMQDASSVQASEVHFKALSVLYQDTIRCVAKIFPMLAAASVESPRVREAELVALLLNGSWCLESSRRRLLRCGAKEWAEVVRQQMEQTTGLLIDMHATSGRLSRSVVPDAATTTTATSQGGRRRQRVGTKANDSPAQLLVAATPQWLETLVEMLALHACGRRIDIAPTHRDLTALLRDANLGRQLVGTMLGRLLAASGCSDAPPRVLWALASMPSLAQNIVHAVVRLASDENDAATKSMALWALQAAPDASPSAAPYHTHGAVPNPTTAPDAVVSAVLLALYRLALHGVDAAAPLPVPGGAGGGATNLAIVVDHALSARWFTWVRATQLAQAILPELVSEECSRALGGIDVVPTAADSSSSNGTSSSAAAAHKSNAQRLMHALVFQASSPHWREALLLAESIHPHVREVTTEASIKRSEQDRMVAIALRHQQGVVSKRAERNVRRALDERLRIDVLEHLSQLRRQHNWKEAVSIYEEYGLQLLRSGCGYAFAFAAARHPPFAEVLGSDMEGYGGTCRSVGTAVLTAAVNLWRNRRYYFADTSSPVVQSMLPPSTTSSTTADDGAQGGTIGAVHFDREAVAALARHRAKFLATTALHILPKPLHSDLLTTVTTKVMDMLESDEVTATDFLQRNGALDEQALEESRLGLERVLTIAHEAGDTRSALHHYHHFRRSFPGCQPRQSSFWMLLDMVVADTCLASTPSTANGNDANASVAACFQAVKGCDGSWVPQFSFVSTSSVSDRGTVALPHLVADAHAWQWSDALLERLSVAVVGHVSKAFFVEDRGATTMATSGVWVVVLMWCRALRNATSDGERVSSLLKHLPQVLDVLFTCQGLAVVATPPPVAARHRTVSLQACGRREVDAVIGSILPKAWGIVGSAHGEDAVWLASRRMWLTALRSPIETFDAQAFAVQQFGALLDLSAGVTSPSARSFQDRAAEHAASHVALLDLWSWHHLGGPSRRLSEIHNNTDRLSSRIEAMRRTAVHLRQLVDAWAPHITRRERDVSERGQYLLLCLVEAWLPFVYRVLATLWPALATLWTQVCARPPLGAVTTRVMTYDEEAMSLRVLRDVRWDLTNIARELSVLLKAVCVKEVLEALGVHSAPLVQRLVLAREPVVRLHALCLRHVINPQQLDLIRRSLESVVYYLDGLCKAPVEDAEITTAPQHNEMPQGSTYACLSFLRARHAIMEQRSGVVSDVAAKPSHADMTSTAEVHLVAALQSLAQRYCRSDRRGADDEQQHQRTVVLQWVHMLQAAVIDCGSALQHLSDDAVQRIEQIVSDTLMVGASADPLPTAAVAKWLLRRVAQVSRDGGDAASVHDTVNALANMHVLAEYEENVMRHLVSPGAQPLETQYEPLQFRLTNLVNPATSTVHTMVDDLIYSVSATARCSIASPRSGSDNDATADDDDNIMSLLQQLSVSCVDRWDLAVYLALDTSAMAAGATAATTSLLVARRIELILRGFVGWPSVLALRLFLKAEPYISDSDVKQAMVMTISPSSTLPAVVSFALRDAEAIRQGLEVVAGSATSSNKVPYAAVHSVRNDALVLVARRAAASIGLDAVTGDAASGFVAAAYQTPDAMAVLAQHFATAIAMEEGPSRSARDAVGSHWLLHNRHEILNLSKAAPSAMRSAAHHNLLRCVCATTSLTSVVVGGNDAALPTVVLSYRVALWNTAVVGFLHPKTTSQPMLRLPREQTPSIVRATPPRGGGDASNATMAHARANVSMSVIPNLPINTSPTIVVSYLVDALMSALHALSTTDAAVPRGTATFAVIAQYVAYWMRCLFADLVQYNKPSAVFAARQDLDVADLTVRKKGALLLIAEWRERFNRIIVENIPMHVEGSDADASSLTRKIRFWSDSVLVLLLVRFMDAGDIPDVERAMAQFIVHADGVYHQHGATQRRWVEGTPLSHSSTTSSATEACHRRLASKLRRWSSPTMQSTVEKSPPSTPTPASDIKAACNSIERMDESGLASHVPNALRLIRDVVRPMSHIDADITSGPVHALCSRLIAAVCALLSARQGAQHSAKLSAHRPVLDDIVGLAFSLDPPRVMVAGHALRAVLTLASMRDRLDQGPGVPASTLRAVLAAETAHLPRRDMPDVQAVLDFFLAALRTNRDFVDAQGWTSARSTLLDVSYTVVLDYLCSVDMLLPNRGASIVNTQSLLVLQETFGPQCAAMLCCIESTLVGISPDTASRSSSGAAPLPSSNDVKEAWRRLGGYASAHQSTPIVSAKALLYYLSGRWKGAVEACPLRHVLTEYQALLKLEVGRTRGVPEKKRHLIPLGSFATRCTDAILDTQYPTVLRAPLLSPDDAALHTVIRLLTQSGQHAAVLQLVLATHATTWMNSVFLSDALVAASECVTLQSAPVPVVPVDVSFNGHALYVLWLGATTYQHVHLCPYAIPPLLRAMESIQAATVIEGGSIAECVDASLGVSSVFKSTHSLSRRIERHLQTSLWVRLVHTLSSLTVTDAQDTMMQWSSDERRMLQVRTLEALRANRDNLTFDRALLRILSLVSPTPCAPATGGNGVQVPWWASLNDLVEGMSWRRAVGVLQHVEQHDHHALSTTSMVSTRDVLLMVVLKAAVAADGHKSSGKRTPAKALWARGKGRIVSAARTLASSPTSEATDRGKSDGPVVEASRIDHILTMLKFLLSSQAKGQWTMALPMAWWAAKNVEHGLGVVAPDVVQREHQTRFASLHYLLHRCGAVEREVSHRVLEPYLSLFADAAMENDPSLPTETSRIRKENVRLALRALSRHPRSSWAAVVGLWCQRNQEALRNKSVASFPINLAYQIFRKLKEEHRYEQILEVAERLDMGPHRDRKIEEILTDAATHAAPRAVHNVLLCLRGQLVAKKVSDLLQEQEHARRVETISRIRQSLLRGHWQDALLAVVEQPSALDSQRLVDTCLALASKGKGSTTLLFVQAMVGPCYASVGGDASALLLGDPASHPHRDAALEDTSSTRSLLNRVASNGALIDACLGSYVDEASLRDGCAQQYAPVAVWLMYASLFLSRSGEAGSRANPSESEEGRVPSTALQHAIHWLPMPPIPLISEEPPSRLETYDGLLWAFLNVLQDACRALDTWRGRDLHLPMASKRVKWLCLHNPSALVSILAVAVAFRPAVVRDIAAVVRLCYPVTDVAAVSSNGDIDKRNALLTQIQCMAAYSAKYVIHRREWRHQRSSDNGCAKQRDVVVFSPNAVSNWVEALSVVCASHHHHMQRQNSDGGDATLTGALLRRCVRLAACSQSNHVIQSCFTFLVSAARWGEIMATLPSYFQALHAAKAGASSLAVHHEAVKWLQTISAALEEDPQQDGGNKTTEIGLPIVAALLDGMCTTSGETASEDGISTIGRPVPLLALVQRVVERLVGSGTQTDSAAIGTGPAISHPMSSRIRLATSWLALLGRLSASEQLRDSTERQHRRGADEEVAFWSRPCAVIIEDVSKLCGTDAVLPSDTLSQKEVEQQALGLMQLLDNHLSICQRQHATTDAQRAVMFSVFQRFFAPNALTMRTVATNEEAKAILKVWAIRVGGKQWRALFQELTTLGASGADHPHAHTVASTLTATARPTAFDAASDRFAEEQLHSVLHASASWETALIHMTQYNAKYPPNATHYEIMLQRLIEAVTGSHPSTHDDTCAKLEEGLFAQPMAAIASALHLNMLSQGVLPTTSIIDRCLTIYSLLGHVDDVMEYLRSLEVLPQRPATPSSHGGVHSFVVPYVVRANTQALIVAIIEAFWRTKHSESEMANARYCIARFVQWFASSPRNEAPSVALLTALLSVLCPPESEQRTPSIDDDDHLLALVALIECALRTKATSERIPQMGPATLLRLVRVVSAGGAQSPQLQRPCTELLSRVLEACSTRPELHASLAAECAVATNSRRSMATVDQLVVVLEQYKRLVEATSPPEARALASAMPKPQLSVHASVWAHTMSLMRSIVLHANDDAGDGVAAAGEGTTLLPSLHCACDVLVTEGKWRMALHCATAVAQAHVMHGMDDYVVAKVALYFAQLDRKAAAAAIMREQLHVAGRVKAGSLKQLIAVVLAEPSL